MATLAYTAVVIAVSYLACVDWTHPNTPKGPQ